MGPRSHVLCVGLLAALLALAGCGGPADTPAPVSVTPAPVPATERSADAGIVEGTAVTIQNTRNETVVVTIAVVRGDRITVIYRNGSAGRATAPVAVRSAGPDGTDGAVDHVEPVGDPVFASAYEIEPEEVRVVPLGDVPANATLVYTVRPTAPADRTPPLSQWGATRCARSLCEYLFVL